VYKIAHFSLYARSLQVESCNKVQATTTRHLGEPIHSLNSVRKKKKERRIKEKEGRKGKGKKDKRKGRGKRKKKEEQKKRNVNQESHLKRISLKPEGT
jgi:hypothetical protein